MTSGKIMVSMLVLVAVLTGLAVYYLQVYGFYDPVDEITGARQIVLTDAAGVAHPVAVSDFKAIDASSSPIRYRACFRLDPAATQGAQPFAAATPLNGPGWFQCYSARALTADLASGAATAYLGQSEIHPDVDRVIAVYPDGRAFAWHQFNEKNPERGVMD